MSQDHVGVVCSAMNQERLGIEDDMVVVFEKLTSR